MLSSIWDDVKQQFNSGNMIIRLIIVNVSIFLIINLLKVFLHHGGGTGSTPDIYSRIMSWFKISSEPIEVVLHPWSVFTHMFMHEGFWHILWNMLFLYWFGRILGDLIGDRRILPIYLLGGLAGALSFFLSVNLLPYGGTGTHLMLGASGGIMAIVVAAGAIAPDYNFRLILLGDVKLKYIVLAVIFLDLVGTAGNINTGGHFAHLGGALMGWFFISQLHKGTDLSEPINGFFEKITGFFRGLSQPTQRKRQGPKIAHRNEDKIKRRQKNTRSGHRSDSTPGNSSHQEKLDAILDKIKKEGYESLSEAEKEFLFNASKQ